MANQVSAKRDYDDIHGIILLNKPKGISSNLALQKLRHKIKAKKAGHTGNLDPMATGLLPCCFGDATKVAHLLINSDKTYQARCVLGSKTDTGDATGEVIETKPIKQLTDAEVIAACAQLTGEISQVPPMYSALHHQGRRLYDLARQGITVERPPRKVMVHQFKLIKNSQAHIDFEINVSKGTYIRTLLEDFAALCGTVAHMSALHRIKTGIFNSDEMLLMDQIEAASQITEVLMPIEQALIEYPQIQLKQPQVQDLIHGKKTACEQANGVYVLMDSQSIFLGLGEIHNHLLKVKKIFMKSYLQQLEKLD